MTNIQNENKRLLDVVNEKDEIVGLESRTDIHKRGLLHREVHVWIFDPKQNLIFQKRGLHRRSAGQLDASAGGHVNRNEDYLAAALREVKEETGLSLKSADLILVRKARGKETSKNFLGTINNFFRAVYVCKKPIDIKKIKKEKGIPGGGFQKVSLKFLLNPESEGYSDAFIPFVLIEELPYILPHIK